MIVRTLSEIEGTERDVRAETWHSRRFVLAREGVGFSFHETVMYAGTETPMWYAHHIEAVYCVGGEGELVDDETGEVHHVTDGTMYLLNGHEHHRMRPKTDMRLICVFNPPVTGAEVHDENGVYPLLTEPDTRTEEVAR